MVDAAVLTLCLATAVGAQGDDDELNRAMAQVVDSREFPSEAAALESVPYRMLLNRAEVSPDERTLSDKTAIFTYGDLLANPDDHRGKVVLATGYVAQISIVSTPGVGRTDRNEVYAGILGIYRKNPKRFLYWAFRILRRPGDAILYVGDSVNLSGYFFKNVPVVDALGQTHWMPFVVGPWPTYRGEWWPASVVMGVAQGKLPAQEMPHDEVWRRPVVDALSDGTLALNGYVIDPATITTALQRYGRNYPERVVVVRADSEEVRSAARHILLSAGMDDRAVWKNLTPASR